VERVYFWRALSLSLLLLYGRPALADCGIYNPPKSVEALLALVKRGEAHRVLPGTGAVLYLQKVEHCCLSGVPLSEASIYQIEGQELRIHELCEASGPGGVKIREQKDLLLVTRELVCRDGALDECDAGLAKEQRKLDAHPIRLQWKATGFVDLDRQHQREKLEGSLLAAIKGDQREEVLRDLKELRNIPDFDLRDGRLRSEQRQKMEELQGRVLRYQIDRSLRAIRRLQAPLATAELKETLDVIGAGYVPSSCQVEDQSKIRLENDIAFVFEQAGQAGGELLRAKIMLECISKRDPTRAVAWLNLSDLYQKFGEARSYPLESERYREQAKEAARRYLALMEARALEAKVPKRIRILLAPQQSHPSPDN